MNPLGLTMARESFGRDGSGSRRRYRRWSVLLGLLALVGMAALIGGKVAGTWVENHFGGGADYSGPGTGEVVVQVRSGETVRQIAGRLEEQGVVRSAAAFLTAARAEPRAQQIQPGFYRLCSHMSAATAMRMMLAPMTRVGAVIIPEGLWRDEVFDLIAKRGGLDRAAVLAAARSPSPLGLPGYARGQLEGMLFPARYDISHTAEAKAVLAEMVARYQREAAELRLEERAELVGMTPYQIVIIASLIQAEARRHEDFGKVSRVIYNRLGGKFAFERRLQFDSTINYARRTRTLRLTSREIAVFHSPYNTYTHAGLPPTPICNPGRDALEAALAPTPGSWRYFVTVAPRTGETRFTDNYQRFLVWKQEFQQNLRSS